MLTSKIVKGVDMSDAKLKPTYWRTCRALANEDRLRLFKAVVENEGRFSVRQYARLLGLQDDVASVYLRQMNARGLLGVRREHIKVFYNLNRDRSLPQAVELEVQKRAFYRAEVFDVTNAVWFAHGNPIWMDCEM